MDAPGPEGQRAPWGAYHRFASAPLLASACLHALASVQCHACARWQSISQVAAAAPVQIVETRLGDGSQSEVGSAAEVAVADGALHISCGGGGVLKVPVVDDRAQQPAGWDTVSGF